VRKAIRILTCVLCGEKPKLYEEEFSDQLNWWANCVNDCHPDARAYSSIESAVKHWNKRVPRKWVSSVEVEKK
jgi:hypothetical protein